MTDRNAPTEFEIESQRHDAEVQRRDAEVRAAAVARRTVEAARAAKWQNFIDNERAAANARREARRNRGA